jgi:hypothetical protein
MGEALCDIRRETQDYKTADNNVLRVVGNTNTLPPPDHHHGGVARFTNDGECDSLAQRQYAKLLLELTFT